MPLHETRRSMEKALLIEAHKSRIWRRYGRRRGDGSMPAMVEPPKGPRPFQGGAAAPLEFD